MTFIDRLGVLDGVFVKICGLTSEADALLAVGMGVAAVGFVFAPSPRQMTPSAVADITKRLPHETVTVGSFETNRPSGSSRSPIRSAFMPSSSTAWSRPRTAGGSASGPAV